MPPPRDLRSVAVFCGSSPGVDPAYRDAAEATGRLLAERGIRLVYGGGNVGLMGVVADAALAAGGDVVGVIPRALLEREVAHLGLSELLVVETMHERKKAIYGMADAVVAMPGGVGTLEELCEAMTWTQLGYHHLPCGLLDVAGYWRPLVELLDHATAQGFLRPTHRAVLLADDDPGRLLERLAAAELPTAPKWLEVPRVVRPA